MTTLQSNKQAGDFLIYEDDARYCRLSLPVENAAAAEVTINDIAAMPVIIDAGQTKFTLLEVGQVGRDESDVNGFLLNGEKQTIVAAGNSRLDFGGLWSGPATLNEDAIPATDAYGNAITLANVKAGALANMEDIRFVSEPEIQSVQTADS